MGSERDPSKLKALGSATSIHSVNIPKLSIFGLIFFFFFPLSCYFAIPFNTPPPPVSEQQVWTRVDDTGRYEKRRGPSFQGRKRDPHNRHNSPHPTHISAPQQKKTYNILANKKVAYGATPER